MGAKSVERSVRHSLRRLESLLDRLGLYGSVVLMTVAVTAVVMAVNLLLKYIEGQPLVSYAMINVPLEMFAVAGPLILYSRRRRAELQVMSRELSSSAYEAEKASRAKSAFLANMSHELRTPLNAILGFSEIMREQHLGPLNNPRYLSYAGDIHTSGRHLLGIINDVLDLAKIEAGKMTLDTATEFALVPALSASLTMLTGLGQRNGVTVRGSWQDEKIRLMAEERMVRQIVINLVGNAIKFTPAGGQVELSGAPQADGGYVLQVRDTGLGMDESEIAHALEPFGQNRSSHAKRQEGTGLGLPLAKAMMELHGGRLSMESRPNQGTCVSLQFPPERVKLPREQQAA